METIKQKRSPKVVNTDFETASLDEVLDGSVQKESRRSYLTYLLFGVFFGIILVKSEVISWYRIQEMFRLQSFHMYGILGSAVIIAMVSVWLIKKFNVRSIDGEKINLPQKPFHKGVVYGGIMFGLGWALTGACPGPLYALVGSGHLIIVVPLLSAVAGAYVFGLFRERLP